MKNRDRGQAPSQRSVEEYLRLPYTIHVIRDESGGHPGFFARVLEFSGCMTQADDFAELGDMVEDAMRAWIETAQEDGQTIPEPWPLEAYSGRFVVRMPRSLHRQLVETAEREGVSLNAYVTIALARVVGFQTDESAVSRPGAKRRSRGEYVASPDRYAQIAESHKSDDQA